MGKRLILIVLASFMLVGLTSASALADEARDNVGCGLGTLIFKGNADTTILQVFAATTNGIGSQTFAITSGTLECKRPARFVLNERLQKFVVDNMDNLAKDIAMGRGESLDTLAEMMQVPQGRRVEFYSLLQANFSNIFTSAKIESADVIDNISALYSN